LPRNTHPATLPGRDSVDSVVDSVIQSLIRHLSVNGEQLYTVRADVDPDNEVAESDEDNNYTILFLSGDHPPQPPIPQPPLPPLPLPRPPRP